MRRKGYEEEQEKSILKLLCQFDLLMLLEGDEGSIGNDCATLGGPMGSSGTVVPDRLFIARIGI